LVLLISCFAKADESTEVSTEKTEEDCCDFLLDENLELEEVLEEALRDLGYSSENTESFRDTPIEDEEDALVEIERVLDTLREAGASDELIERSKDWFEEALESEDLPSRTPEDIRVGQGIKVLEGLIPELQGLSSSWEKTEPVILFSHLVPALAKYHKLPDSELKELISVIEQFIDLVPEQNRELLNVDANHYFRLLVLEYKFMQEELAEFDYEKELLTQLRSDLLSVDHTANTKQIDEFLSCVDDVHKAADKEFSKLFTSLNRVLNRSLNSIEKFNEMDDKQLRDERVAKVVLKTLVPHSSKIINTTFKVTSRICYLAVDVDEINSEIQKHIGDRSNE